MFTRVLTGVMAVAMLVASPAAGSVSHLCLMGGQVRSQCCCPPSANKANRANSANQAEHPDEVSRACCQVRGTEWWYAPVAATVASRHSDVSVVALVPPAPHIERPGSHIPDRILGARGPPAQPGEVPLFIAHCRYLI